MTLKLLFFVISRSKAQVHTLKMLSEIFDFTFGCLELIGKGDLGFQLVCITH